MLHWVTTFLQPYFSFDLAVGVKWFPYFLLGLAIFGVLPGALVCLGLDRLRARADAKWRNFARQQLQRTGIASDVRDEDGSVVSFQCHGLRFRYSEPCGQFKICLAVEVDTEASFSVMERKNVGGNIIFRGRCTKSGDPTFDEDFICSSLMKQQEWVGSYFSDANNRENIKKLFDSGMSEATLENRRFCVTYYEPPDTMPDETLKSAIPTLASMPTGFL